LLVNTWVLSISDVGFICNYLYPETHPERGASLIV